MTDSTTTAWLADAPEFEDAVRAAAEHHGILPELARKDYWVTRVLRSIASDPALAGRVVFKGGTSLSKGWQLIDRFSEDIDLLLTGPGYSTPPERKKDREKLFKRIEARVESETPLRLPDRRMLTQEDWEFHYFRGDFHCNLRYPLPGQTATREGANSHWLVIESGFRGGVQPHARRPLRSLIAEYVETQPGPRAALEPYSADFLPFEMDLLKPERTFAEKLLGLHEHMQHGDDGARLVRTRHYYDVAQIYTRSDDVRQCLAGGELTALLRQAVEVSNAYWNAGIDPDLLDLRTSAALFPTDQQIRILKSSYQSERALYYRDTVPFDTILAVMQAIAEAL